MWTAANRGRHVRAEGEYPSSLTEAEWAVLAPLIPPAKPGGRPRGTDMRSAMEALFYLLRTGCPWRYLPRDGRFPPRTTVYNIFRGLGRDGAWEAISAALVAAERRQAGRDAQPTAGVLDSQTTKAAERGGAAPDPWAMTRARRSRGASVTS